MFECSIPGLLLKRLLESLKDICTDVNLECNQQGISMQAMDNSHVALVHLQLPVEFFAEYRCDHGCILGINIPHMLKVLNIVKENSEVFLSKSDSDEDDTDSLRIAIYDAETLDNIADDDQKRAETLTVDLKMVDMEKEHLDIPESNHTCTCTMKSKKFQEIVRYLNTVGESSKSFKFKLEKLLVFMSAPAPVLIFCLPTLCSVTITIEKHHLLLEADGDSIKVKKQFRNLVNDVFVTSTEPISQEFATRYLVMFSRASSIAESVSLGLSANIPLSLRFGIGSKSGVADMELEDVASLSFFLAPKIDEE
ncbi:proliferating cell nuclear antigen PCna2 [Cardiosporidium cionae]|uniref:DNA sliding clamp PCNA n=1 Tax=Cardiosporidium cionae TaxID=476202 RepID=A0ABQ7J4B9_9APIC|nr:proliferating cell nuclear antigen PCna2 [Cardiosporidium cionae]|eukprot:KAF8817925.1 proliferating cell nuclear antigen PCna2 [Cardiosporidium cionae]